MTIIQVISGAGHFMAFCAEIRLQTNLYIFDQIIRLGDLSNEIKYCM